MTAVDPDSGSRAVIATTAVATVKPSAANAATICRRPSRAFIGAPATAEWQRCQTAGAGLDDRSLTEARRSERSTCSPRHELSSGPGDSFTEIRDRAIRAGVQIEHEIIDGDHPAWLLMKHAHQHGFDVIICGQHHSRRAGRLLLHGVAEDLVNAAAVPVLVVGEEPN